MSICFLGGARLQKDAVGQIALARQLSWADTQPQAIWCCGESDKSPSILALEFHRFERLPEGTF
jgi:hypothetical protein